MRVSKGSEGKIAISYDALREPSTASDSVIPATFAARLAASDRDGCSAAMKVRPCDCEESACVRFGPGACPCRDGGQHYPAPLQWRSRFCVPMTRVQRRKRRNAFRQEGADWKPVTPLSLPRRDICVRCKPSHPSPSAHEFRVLLNGLLTSALRRMIVQLPAAAVPAIWPRGQFSREPISTLALACAGRTNGQYRSRKRVVPRPER